MVTVSHKMVGLERMSDYRGVGLQRFHCTSVPTYVSVSTTYCFSSDSLFTHVKFAETEHKRPSSPASQEGGALCGHAGQEPPDHLHETQGVQSTSCGHSPDFQPHLSLQYFQNWRIVDANMSPKV